MSLISFTSISDGSTAKASQVNTPLSTIYDDYNGNITDANISASAAIALSKLAAAAWQSWTPSWTNLTVGNGTVTAKYVQIGKTIHFRVNLTFGSTTSISGNVSLSLPATASSDYSSNFSIGDANSVDTGTDNFHGTVNLNSTTAMTPLYLAVTGSLIDRLSITSSTPFTWASTDQLLLTGTYEAA